MLPSGIVEACYWKSSDLWWVLNQILKTGLRFFKNLIRIITEIGEECGGGEPGSGGQNENEARSLDTLNLFHYFA